MRQAVDNAFDWQPVNHMNTKEKLQQLIDSLPARQTISAFDWRTKFPYAAEICDKTHPLEPGFVEGGEAERPLIRLKLEIQVLSAQLLIDLATHFTIK